MNVAAAVIVDFPVGFPLWFRPNFFSCFGKYLKIYSVRLLLSSLLHFYSRLVCKFHSFSLRSSVSSSIPATYLHISMSIYLLVYHVLSSVYLSVLRCYFLMIYFTSLFLFSCHCASLSFQLLPLLISQYVFPVLLAPIWLRQCHCVVFFSNLHSRLRSHLTNLLSRKVSFVFVFTSASLIFPVFCFLIYLFHYFCFIIFLCYLYFLFTVVWQLCVLHLCYSFVKVSMSVNNKRVATSCLAVSKL